MPKYTKDVTYRKDRWKVDEQKILEIIKEEEVINASILAKELGVNYSSAKKYLEALLNEGKLSVDKLESTQGNRTYKQYSLKK